MRSLRRAAQIALLAVLLCALPALAQVHAIDASEVDAASKAGGVALVSPMKAGERLGWATASGPGFPPGSLLFAPRTRTPGLITYLDLDWTGTDDPDTDTRPVASAAGRLLDLRALERKIEASEAQKMPLLITYAIVAGAAMFVGVAALKRSAARPLARALLTLATAGTLILAAPAQLALVPIAAVVGFVATSGTLAAGALALSARRAIPNLLLTLPTTVALDTLLGLHYVALSPLSAYYIAGIRFYGIGNEYMGLLLGAYLMATPPRLRLPVGVALVLLLGLPMLGANAGGALAATVGLVALVGRGRWQSRGALGVLAALAVAVALAVIDRMQPGAAQSHIGQAAGQGPAGWGAIVVRKLAMNLRLGVAVPTLAAIFGLAPVWWWMAKAKGGAPIRDAVAGDPDLRRRLEAALLAAAAAIVFNDSGIVAAILLMAPVTVTLLDRALSPEATVGDTVDRQVA